MRAIQNVRRICEEHLRGLYDLEVVDIYKNLPLARGDQIIAAPTLIKRLKFLEDKLAIPQDQRIPDTLTKR